MMQKQTQGRVVPESFTHGTSAQRVKWFKAGLETGRYQLLRHVQQQPLSGERVAGDERERPGELAEVSGDGPEQG